MVALLALSGTVSAQAAGGADGSGDERTTAELADVQLGLVPGRPRVRPTRLDTPPVIDGRLDDEAWRRAAVLADFVQESPLDGASATENTEVFVAYDDDYLYFGFYAHYENPSIMRASRVDRDRAMADDLFTVFLDPFLGRAWLPEHPARSPLRRPELLTYTHHTTSSALALRRASLLAISPAARQSASTSARCGVARQPASIGVQWCFARSAR